MDNTWVLRDALKHAIDEGEFATHYRLCQVCKDWAEMIVKVVPYNVITDSIMLWSACKLGSHEFLNWHYRTYPECYYRSDVLGSIENGTLIGRSLECLKFANMIGAFSNKSYVIETAAAYSNTIALEYFYRQNWVFPDSLMHDLASKPKNAGLTSLVYLHEALGFKLTQRVLGRSLMHKNYKVADYILNN